MIRAVPVLFSRLLVPTAVRRELAANSAGNAAALQALDDYVIFEPCNDYDPASVEILLQERKYRWRGKDQGEAEAVSQASQRSAQMVLVDDALGRKWAEKMKLECHGTLWIFEQLRTLEWIPELRQLFALLLRNGRRQPLSEMNRILRRYDEPQIAGGEFRHLTSVSPLG
jgi:predicted nucleic acid-binding protein